MSVATAIYEKLTVPGKTTKTAFVALCKATLGQLEGTYYDYKQTSGDWASQLKLGDSDKRNWCHALSGFANEGGDVLVWGIRQTEKKVAGKTVRNLKGATVKDCVSFADRLLGLVSVATDAPVPGVQVTPVALQGGAGFVVCLIPESDRAPHQVALQIDGQHKYFGRAGDSFYALSHSRLEDLFGRRPRPRLELTNNFPGKFIPGRRDGAGNIKEWDVRLTLTNVGRSAAKHVAIAVERHPLVRPNVTSAMWNCHNDDGDYFVFEMPSARVLYPGQSWNFTHGLKVANANTGDTLELHGVLHCDGGAPVEWSIAGLCPP